MSSEKASLTRRSFLQMAGMAGGAAAVYDSAVALGMVREPDPWSGPIHLAKGVGDSLSVVVLGAGVGGLTAAFELRRAGYSVTLLEAQDRAGGRSLTARRGTVIHQEGLPDQISKLTRGLYVNMGPGRLPYHHRRALHYCKLLGVALEVYVMTSSANVFQTDAAFGGQAVTRQRITHDTRGYIAELLAKAARRFDIDAQLSNQDVERLVDLLRVFGDLEASTLDFNGTTRSGCRFPVTVNDGCQPEPPLPLAELLTSEFWQHRYYQPEDGEWQPTLFQPVGGMDKIVDGFLNSRHPRRSGEKLSSLILYNQDVQRVLLEDERVTVIYQDRVTGHRRRHVADYCVSNMPLPVLQGLPGNFASDFKAAVNTARFAPACKVGWEATQRFWENNANKIYGGISFTDDIITQMWYPSDGYLSKRGTLTGLYNFGDDAVLFGDMDLDERLRVARQGAIRLHGQFADDAIVPRELGLSIAWQKVPFQRGAWPSWSSSDSAAYSRLLEPDRRFHVVGDQVSQLPGWQEGAMASARHVVEQIAGVRPKKREGITRAPDTQRLVEGLY